VESTGCNLKGCIGHLHSRESSDPWKEEQGQFCVNMNGDWGRDLCVQVIDGLSWFTPVQIALI
jgi:hypothetical protein